MIAPLKSEAVSITLKAVEPLHLQFTARRRPRIFDRQATDQALSSDLAAQLSDMAETTPATATTAGISSGVQATPTSESASPTDTSTPFTVLSPVYLAVLIPFVLFLFIMIWFLMIPDARRPWSCRSHRKRQLESISLRQRGPGDAYEIEPNMWRGGGRFRGENTTGGRSSHARVDDLSNESLVKNAGKMGRSSIYQNMGGATVPSIGEATARHKLPMPVPPPPVYKGSK